MTYDLAILGAGPAGAAAGVYAARKKLNTVFITYDFGGQSIVSPDIQNWIGTKSIPGDQLAKNLEEHVRSYEGEDFKIITGQYVTGVTKSGENFEVTTDNGEKFETKTVLVSTGSQRRKLPVPGAEEFDQKGLTYCASCDGPLFTDKDVVVIGGGNAGFETAGQLLAYTKSVTLLHRGPDFKADAITVDKLMKNPKFKAIRNADTLEVKGDGFVTGLTYKDKESGETHELDIQGVFVEIGFIPNTAYIKDVVELDNFGAVKIDCPTQQTNVPGIWAAGDCTSVLYHQNNIAAGDGVKAIEDIYGHLHLK